MLILASLLYRSKLDQGCIDASPTQTYTNDWSTEKNKCGTYTKVIISSEVTSIIDHAFEKCDKVQTIEFNQRLQTIGNSAFEGLEILKELIFPDSLISIGNYAFKGCRLLTTIKFSNSLKTIGDNAFEGCYVIKSLTIPKSLTKIGQHIFQNVQDIKTVIFEDGLTFLGDYMFESGTGLTSITMPDSITKIGQYCFQECYNLATIKFSENLQEINDFAFYYCKSIKTLELPKSLKMIGYNAFERCLGLTSITLPERLITLNNNAFGGILKLTEITVCCKKLDLLGTFLNSGRISKNVNKIEFKSSEFKFLQDIQLISSLSTIILNSNEIINFPDMTGLKNLQYLYINNTSSSLMIYQNRLPKTKLLSSI